MTGEVSQHDKDSHQEKDFENGTLETCFASSSGKPVDGGHGQVSKGGGHVHGEQLLLELHMRQAADLIYQVKMTMTMIIMMINMMMKMMMMMMMMIRQAAEVEDGRIREVLIRRMRSLQVDMYIFWQCFFKC